MTAQDAKPAKASLAKALQRDPAQRYATADAFAQDIERHLAGDPVLARPDSRWTQVRRVTRRHWVGLSAIASVVLAIVVGGGVAVVQAQRATRAAEREQVVKNFIADVFRANGHVDRGSTSLRPSSPQALVEGGAQLIQTRFAGQPGLQAELYGVVGGVFSEMGAYRLAVDYYDRQVLALEDSGIDRHLEAKALLDLAQALFDAHRFADAEARVNKVIDTVAESNPLKADALVLLARLESTTSRDQVALATVDRLRSLQRSQPSSSPSANAWSLVVQAKALSTQNRLDEALPLYRQAIGIMVDGEGPLSLAAVAMRLDLCELLDTTLSGGTEARQQLDAAVKVLRQLGGTHGVRASLVTAEFAQRGYIGFHHVGLAEAIELLRRSREELAESRFELPDGFIPQIDFWLGSVLTWSGDAAGGWALLRKTEPRLEVQTQTLAERRAFNATMGLAARDVGEHRLAEEYFLAALALRQQMGQGLHPYAARDYADLASNYMMAGAFAEAEATLDAAPPFRPMQGQGMNPSRHVSRLLLQTRAELRIAESREASALEILETVPPTSDDGEIDLGNYHEALGAALCALGRPAEGLGFLKKAVGEGEPEDDFPSAPWLARMHAVTGNCAVAAGDLTEGRRFLELARAAFAAQPGVNAYYKNPLRGLRPASAPSKYSWLGIGSVPTRAPR